GLLSPALAGIRKKVVAPLLKGRVMDFGCGVGRLCDLIPVERFVGVDVDDEILAAARLKNPGYVFDNVRALEKLGDFNTIVAMAVIGYVDDLPKLFDNLTANLKPDGRIVITSPTRMAASVHKVGRSLKLFGDDIYEPDTLLTRRPEFEAVASTVGLRVAE